MCEWKSTDKRNCLLFVFRVTVGFFTHTINHSPGPCRKIEGKQVTVKSVSLPVSEVSLAFLAKLNLRSDPASITVYVQILKKKTVA